MKRGLSVVTTSLIGYSSSVLVTRVPGTYEPSGPSATRWMRPASISPMTRLVAPRCARPWDAFSTSMTSWTVLAWASAAVVPSTTLVRTRRTAFSSSRAVESASSWVASRTTPMTWKGRPSPSRRMAPWVWAQ